MDESDDFYIQKFGTFVNQTALDEIAIKYKDEYIKIISENKTLLKKAKNYPNLNRVEQQNIAREIINEISKRQGIETPKVDFIEDLEDLASYSKTTKTIKINPNKHDNFAEIMNSLSHEYTHHIDHYNPELGGLGVQLANIGEEVYSTRSTAYDHNPTEIAAHKIGDFIEDAFKQLLGII